MKKKVPMQAGMTKADMKHGAAKPKHATHHKMGVPVGKPRMRSGHAKHRGPK